MIPKLKKNACSLKCYKELTIEKYEGIKNTKIPIECQFTQSFIAIVFTRSFIISRVQSLQVMISVQQPNDWLKNIPASCFLFILSNRSAYSVNSLRNIYLTTIIIKRVFYLVFIYLEIKPKPAHLSHQISNPCKHYFTDQKSLIYQEDCSDCKCGQYWKFCDKYCLCNPQLCKLKRIGCSCNTNCKDEDCICWNNGAECDPDICIGCFHLNDRGLCMKARKNRDIHCRNNEIFFKSTVVDRKYDLYVQKTVIGNSKICKGYGLFLVEPVDKYDMIIQYIGEVINDPEQEARAILSKQDPFFAFEIVDKEKLIDAKYFGNKARFINHSKLKSNC